MPKRTDIHKILVIGSGPIVIGQAAEFDYAGTQACLALKEEGYEVILCNSNPATIMTDPSIADKIYMEPLTLEYIARIVRYERPDAILPGIGGQTGLNLAMQLEKKGILRECNVELLGTKSCSIERAEDRELFKELCEELGEPVLKVELTNEQLCDLLELAIEDYTETVQNWIIEANWSSLYGQNMTNTDLAYAFTVRTMDLSKEYSYWFSKDAGLQQRGPWELKKDYITIEEGKQDYLIPAGRDINGVLYCNPSTSQAALYANYGGLDTLGFAGGYGQAGGGSYGPIGGFYIAQAMDVAYMATDLAYKNRLLRGDLTYKVTAGPEGTHIIHLYSTPGSKLTFGALANLGNSLNLVGSQVWYTYYEVTSEKVCGFQG